MSTKTLADVIDSTPDSIARPDDAVESGVDQRRTVRAAREGPNRARSHCMSKARMVGLCAERCPAEAATADHVIARGTPQSAARNLPKVGACKECKKKESHLVHRLASSMPFGARHARAAESLQVVDGKLAKSQKLLRWLAEGHRYTPVNGEPWHLEMNVPARSQDIEELGGLHRQRPRPPTLKLQHRARHLRPGSVPQGPWSGSVRPLTILPTSWFTNSASCARATNPARSGTGEREPSGLPAAQRVAESGGRTGSLSAELDTEPNGRSSSVRCCSRVCDDTCLATNLVTKQKATPLGGFRYAANSLI